MRRILIEAARRKKRDRHGGNRKRVSVEVLDAVAQVTDEDMLALNERSTTSRRRTRAPPSSSKLRYFAGLTGREAAGVLNISPRKADQLWAYARAWLLERLNGDAG